MNALISYYVQCLAFFFLSDSKFNFLLRLYQDQRQLPLRRQFSNLFISYLDLCTSRSLSIYDCFSFISLSLSLSLSLALFCYSFILLSMVICSSTLDIFQFSSSLYLFTPLPLPFPFLYLIYYPFPLLFSLYSIPIEILWHAVQLLVSLLHLVPL